MISLKTYIMRSPPHLFHFVLSFLVISYPSSPVLLFFELPLREASSLWLKFHFGFFRIISKRFQSVWNSILFKQVWQFVAQSELLLLIILTNAGTSDIRWRMWSCILTVFLFQKEGFRNYLIRLVTYMNAPDVAWGKQPK